MSVQIAPGHYSVGRRCTCPDGDYLARPLEAAHTCPNPSPPPPGFQERLAERRRLYGRQADSTEEGRQLVQLALASWAERSGFRELDLREPGSNTERAYRDRAIKDAVYAGANNSDAAHELGLTRQRIQQIVGELRV